MGASLQSCRKLIDDGAIGEPVAVTGFMLGSGPENWHPDPEFFYKPGGGPMLDMGPYYITTMISLIGGIKSVSGSARATFAERTVGSGAKKGTKFTVETPTYISGTLNFTGGAIGNLVTSFDCWGHKHTNMEIYGTEGSMIVPDPNNFTGAIQIMKAHGKEWIDEPLTHSFAENSRGVGVADMAAAIQENRPHRASGAQAYHVLDVMLGILDAAKAKTTIELNSAVERPEALPVGLPEDSVR
jgi:predicted dehydrogenase